jgi:putative FmdB family regulatory protein
VPIYEYKCPKGHVFEVLQKMSDAPIEACEICGASPVVKVLYPAAIHYKGSGFYSTDYGRGGKKRDTGSDGGETKPAEKKPEKPAAKKPAESGSS